MQDTDTRNRTEAEWLVWFDAATEAEVAAMRASKGEAEKAGSPDIEFIRASYANADRAYTRRQEAMQAEVEARTAATPEPTTMTVAEVAEAAAALGRPFSPADVEDNEDLRATAVAYATAFTGTFEFMVDMAAKARRNGWLSEGQAKGVLNCMVAEARRTSRSAAPVVQASEPVAATRSATSERVTQDGMYRTPDGTIYKVQVAVHGSGRLYAKRLVTEDERTFSMQHGTEGTPEGRFEFERGALYKLTPAMRMTLEEAQAFGKLYGFCVRCGRTLTDEDSIDAGIGPICAGKEWAA